jgi:hypothetical protein
LRGYVIKKSWDEMPPPKVSRKERRIESARFLRL